MPTYVSLVGAVEAEFQNPQELAVLWGDVENEIQEQELDVELVDTYTLLGEYDFLVIFEAADRDNAFQAALAMQRHGLDAQTMPAASTDRFAELVDDI